MRALPVVAAVLLGGCPNEAPRLQPGGRVDGTEARRLRVGPGTGEVRFAPGPTGAQLFVVDGARRQRVDRRPNAAIERMAFDVRHELDLEIVTRPDGGLWSLELAAVDNAPELAALDDASLAAHRRATPATAAGLAEAAQGLLAGVERARALGDTVRAGEFEVTAAEFLSNLGDIDAAQRHFHAALDSPDAEAETRASAHLGLASLAQFRGDLDAVRRHLDSVRPLARGDSVLYARQLGAEATALAERGEHAQALALLPAALDTARRVGDDALLAELHLVAGWRYRDLGDRAGAAEHFEAQYDAALRTQDPRLEGYALFDLSIIRSDFEKDWKGALALLERSIAAGRRAGDRMGLAFSLDGAGEMASTLGDEAALAYHAEALALRRALGSVRGEALTLTSLGSAYTRLGRPAEAIAPISRAIELYSQLGDRTRQAYAWFRLGRAYDVAQRYPEALEAAERALAMSESQRARIASEDRRVSYTASVRNFYDLAVSAAAQQALRTGERRWVDRALEFSERARARSLLDMLMLIDADRPSAEPDLVARDEALRKEIRDAEIDLRRRRAAGEQGERLAIAERALDVKLGDAEALRGRLQSATPRLTGLSSLPIAGAVSVATVVGPSSLVVEYHLVATSSWALVIDGSEARAFRLAPQAELRRQAAAFLQLVSARNVELPQERAHERADRIARADHDAENAGARLRDALMPFGDRLAGKRRLVVVADGHLHLVPWAALVPELPVVTAPSLSVLEAQQRARRPSPTSSLWVLGDPVSETDDPRVDQGVAEGPTATEIDGRFGRMSYARAESEAIATLVPEPQRKVWLGFDATKDRLTSSGGRPRIVHIAAHGVLDTARPERSGLVLTRVARTGRAVDGFLSLADVYALRLPAELVTLSGCQTALGTEVRGEGVIGMTRGFLHAGARAVVASLWKVNDRATADLMVHFYEGVLREGKPYDEALYRAQRKLAGRPRSSAPYYWAGFVLSGDSSAPRPR